MNFKKKEKEANLRKELFRIWGRKRSMYFFLWNFEISKFVSFQRILKERERKERGIITTNCEKYKAVQSRGTQRRWLFVSVFDFSLKELMKNLLLVRSNQWEQLICRYYCATYHVITFSHNVNQWREIEFRLSKVSSDKRIKMDQCQGKSEALSARR